MTILDWFEDSTQSALKCLKNMETVYLDEKNVALNENSVERKHV